MNKYRKQIIDELVKTKELTDKILKEKTTQSLYLFNKYILSAEDGENKLPLAPFHKELCNFVQESRDKKKLILVPRMHLKSTLCTIGYSLFRIVNNPNIRILILSAKYENAVDFVGAIQDHLTKNQILIDTFGNLAKNPIQWQTGRFTLRVNRTVVGEKEPTVLGAGITSNVVSKHFDLIIMDDVVGRENTETIEQIEKVIKRYRDTIDLMDVKAELIMIGTRWTDNDVYSWVLDPQNQQISQYEVFLRKAMQWEGPLEHALMTGEGFLGSLWDKFDRQELLRRYRAKGPYEFCLPGDAPILTSNWTEKPIKEIRVGDELLGYTRGTPKDRSHLVKTKVLKTTNFEDDVFEIVLESGRKVCCTKTHRWYTGRLDKTHRLYVPAKVGSRLMYVAPSGNVDMTDQERLDWHYLAGLFDGEGTTKSTNLMISQSLDKNLLVVEKIREILQRLRIPFTEYIKKHPNHITWGDCVQMVLGKTFETCLNLIRITNLAKKRQLAEKMLSRSKRWVRDEDKVESINYIGKKIVYGIETETGNYVAYGYASENSTQYLNDPVPDTEATFHNDWYKYFEEEDVKAGLFNTYITIDPAISTEKRADYTAMVVTSIDQWGNLYIRDIIRERLSPNETISLMFDLYEAWHPRKIGLEDIAWQKTLAYSAREEMIRRGKKLPIVSIRPNARSKDERIRGLQPLYANGKVFHNRSLVNNKYLEDELMRFPNGQHDDVIDALSYSLDFLVKPKEAVEEARHRYLY